LCGNCEVTQRGFVIDRRDKVRNSLFVYNFKGIFYKQYVALNSLEYLKNIYLPVTELL
jgi:hypothetical protein